MKPLRAVLDTNVLVSAFLNPAGNPGIVLRHVQNEVIVLLLDERILIEYRDVLSRQKFDFDDGLIDETISLFDRLGEFIVANPLDASIPDPDDMPFLEVALSGKADVLITGNKKDFGRAPTDLKILSPGEFLKLVPKLYD